MRNNQNPLSPEAVPSDASELSEDQIDDQLEGTFPASDPPSWTLGVTVPERVVADRPDEEKEENFSRRN